MGMEWRAGRARAGLGLRAGRGGAAGRAGPGGTGRAGPGGGRVGLGGGGGGVGGYGPVGRNVCTARKGVRVCGVKNALQTAEDRKKLEEMGAIPSRTERK